MEKKYSRVRKSKKCVLVEAEACVYVDLTCQARFGLGQIQFFLFKFKFEFEFRAFPSIIFL